MKAIVVGAGGVARDLLRRIGELCEITVVDTDGLLLERAATVRPIETVQGDGSSRVVLERAGVDDDAVVAAARDDDINPRDRPYRQVVRPAEGDRRSCRPRPNERVPRPRRPGLCPRQPYRPPVGDQPRAAPHLLGSSACSWGRRGSGRVSSTPTPSSSACSSRSSSRRRRRVAEIKRAVVTGRYRIPAEAVADAVLEAWHSEAGPRTGPPAGGWVAAGLRGCTGSSSRRATSGRGRRPSPATNRGPSGTPLPSRRP